MDSTMASRIAVDREKTAPFCMRTFVKIGGFHRVDFFEDGTLPTTDEHQIFTWKDATLKEVLTTLRLAAPHSAEIRHPLAKVSFRALYADAAARGRIAQRELGTVYSRDVLGEPGTLAAPAPRLLSDTEHEYENADAGDGRPPERTLDELRFVPGDYVCVSVVLPRHAAGPGPAPPDVAIRGAAAAPGANGWKSARALSPPGPPGGHGRGGGHWRGGSDPAGRGRGGRAERPGRRDVDRELGERDRDRDRDRRVPPPPRRGRESPPHRGGGYGGRDRDRDRDRDGGRERRERSRSRSWSPPRRRGSRYD
ncbi:histone deacetylase complex protein [Phellopilus nigrolimitatus]|nr:histone deacetylase complex protein [Phellopilus nigrolimitatus]